MNTFTDWNDELYHHGIKGQKWGVRRFQNPDGTLINPKGGRAGGNGRQPSNKKTLGQRFSSGAKKVGGAVSYMRAWQKERAENAEKRAKLRTAKNEAKKNSLMYQTVKSLSDNVFSPILKSGTKLATTVIDKVGGKVIGKASDVVGDNILKVGGVFGRNARKGASWLFSHQSVDFARSHGTREGRAELRLRRNERRLERDQQRRQAQQQREQRQRQLERQQQRDQQRREREERRRRERQARERFGDPFTWTF